MYFAIHRADLKQKIIFEGDRRLSTLQIIHLEMMAGQGSYLENLDFYLTFSR